MPFLNDPVLQLFLRDPLFYYLFATIASLYLIFKSADYLIDGVSSYARKLGLSYTLTGLIVVAMAASTPEIFTSLVGALRGEKGIAFGTILGTNMVHLALVTGVLVIISKKMALKCEILDRSKLFLWAILMAPFLLMLDGELSRYDGSILLALFAVYLVRLWRQEGTLGKLKKNVKIKHIWRDALVFMGSLLALLIASILLVFGATGLARLFSIPSYFVAITVIAVGAALPDFAVALRSVQKGVSDIGVGDMLGSTVIELLLYFGLLALIMPFTFDLAEVGSALVFLPIALTTLIMFVRRKKITARHGLLMIGIYAVFLLVETLKVSRFL